MKRRREGRYSGCMMSIYGRIVPAPGSIRGQAAELSRAARTRLSWFEFYSKHGCNARLTCRRFGISPQTFYRWKRRYDPRNLLSLEAHSSRPKHVRKPSWSSDVVEAVHSLRRKYPRWGKLKLQILLQREGRAVSVSMVGRILKRLRERGELTEPGACHAGRRGKRRRPRPYAVRKPWDVIPRAPGEIVQIDTLDVRPLPGIGLKHFTAKDVFTRWDVLGVSRRATSTAARNFLESALKRFPFRVKAIQVDGGSEFKAVFERACQDRGIPLYELPPRSPKLNAHVERSQRCHTEEFYECYDLSWTVTSLNEDLLEWERVYNTIRPHQSLNGCTPLEFLTAWRISHNQQEELSPRY
jgi:putative transposase